MSNQKAGTKRPRDPRAPAACDYCKSNHRKCSGTAPCTLCSKRKLVCVIRGEAFEPLAETADQAAHSGSSSSSSALAHAGRTSTASDIAWSVPLIHATETELSYLSAFQACTGALIHVLEQELFDNFLQNLHYIQTPPPSALNTIPGPQGGPQAQEAPVTVASVGGTTLGAPAESSVGQGSVPSSSLPWPDDASSNYAEGEEMLIQCLLGQESGMFANAAMVELDTNSELYCARVLFHAVCASGALDLGQVEASREHYQMTFALIGPVMCCPHPFVSSAMLILAFLGTLYSSDRRRVRLLLRQAELLLEEESVNASPHIRHTAQLLAYIVDEDRQRGEGEALLAILEAGEGGACHGSQAGMGTSGAGTGAGAVPPRPTAGQRTSGRDESASQGLAGDDSSMAEASEENSLARPVAGQGSVVERALMCAVTNVLLAFPRVKKREDAQRMLPLLLYAQKAYTENRVANTAMCRLADTGVLHAGLGVLYAKTGQVESALREYELAADMVEAQSVGVRLQSMTDRIIKACKGMAASGFLTGEQGGRAERIAARLAATFVTLGQLREHAQAAARKAESTASLLIATDPGSGSHRVSSHTGSGASGTAGAAGSTVTSLGPVPVPVSSSPYSMLRGGPAMRAPGSLLGPSLSELLAPASSRGGAGMGMGTGTGGGTALGPPVYTPGGKGWDAAADSSTHHMRLLGADALSALSGFAPR